MTNDYSQEMQEVADSIATVYENKQVNKKNDISGDFSSDNVSYPTAKAVKALLNSSYLTSTEINTLLSSYALSSSIPTALSDLTNDCSFVTSSDVPSDVSDLTDTTGVIPTATSDLTNDSGFISDVSDKADKTGGVAQVTDANSDNYTHIGSLSSGATQQTINSAINTALGVIKSIEFIKITDDKGTASADTMNKLYIVSENSKVNIYYTKKTGSTYSWVKLDSDILDEITIPVDVSDLTDTQNTAFTPKSHTHGNLTNDGKVGSDSGKPLITTTGGAVTTGAFGTSSGQFAEGNHTHSGYMTSTDVHNEISAVLTGLANAINPPSS